MSKSRFIVVLFLACLLAGCHGGGGGTVRRDDAPSSTSAQRYMDQGQYAQAAASYESLAANARGASKDGLLLQAADAWFRTGSAENGINALRQVDAGDLRGTDTDRYRLLTAHAALVRGAARRALNLLDFDGDRLPDDLYIRWRELRAQANETLGRNTQSVSERIALASRLSDPEAGRKNGRAILTTLRQVPMRQLESYRRDASNDPVLLGWIDFALMVRAGWYDPEQFTRAVADWRRRYPDHPSNLQLADAGLETTTTFERPRRIALLLPRSGRFSGAGRAVRDGFLAAWYADSSSERRPIVHIYDTGANTATLTTALNRALAEGAELIVGPVQRNNVEALLGRSIPVPVLALNYVDAPAHGSAGDPMNGSASPDFFQFGLSPEQEAHQAAERARRDAGSRALVLHPDDAWGRRLRDAFVERFTQLGGVIVDQAAFSPTQTDYSATLEQLLALNESQARQQNLRSILGQPLEFEPQRRHDVDFAFLAARPNQARSIKPQLRFHRASDLPVYATSSVFSGRANPGADRDMDGIVFCDIPWLLADTGVPDRESVVRALPGAEGNLARLYALGIDAYQIAPYLRWLQANPGDAFPGNTGWLSMDTGGRVYRQLLWARFLGGRPRLISSTGQVVAGN